MSLKSNGLLGHEKEYNDKDYDRESGRLKPNQVSGSSFLRRISPMKPKMITIGRTSWLDGLRGFAAFLVYWHHHQLWVHDTNGRYGTIFYENGFGFRGHYFFVSFPFTRIFFSGGHFAVAIFLVISGYVLSAKGLQYIQAGEREKLGDSVASSFLRRWTRLFLPILGTTAVYFSLWHFFGLWAASAMPQPTIFAEIYEWFFQFKYYANIFDRAADPFHFCRWYNFHLWTIAFEYRGSLIIFVLLTIFSRTTQNARFFIYAVLILYSLFVIDGWYSALFLGGMTLSDLDLLAVAGPGHLPDIFYRFEPHKKTICWCAFVAGLWFAGVPCHQWSLQMMSESPGWYWASIIKYPSSIFDPKWFFLFFSATFLVGSIPRLPIKHFFETPFCQYLARISYALYLVHGPVIWTLGDRVYAAVGWIREEHVVHYPGWKNAFPLPTIGPMGLEPAFWIPHIILLPFTFLMAECVTAWFDEPSVKFCSWMWRQMLAPRPGQQRS